MIELLVAFALGALAAGVPAGYALAQAAKREGREAAQLGAVLDRVQSPDLASYYGARAAWHPQEFPQEPMSEYQYDDFGYVQDEKRDDDRLPGELPPEAG